MAGEEQFLLRTLTQLLQSIQPAIVYRQALLGDGTGQVSVPNRLGYCYVRLLSDDTKVLEVFGAKISGLDGTPVMIGTLPWSPDFTQIVDIDWGTITINQTGGGLIPYLPLHGPTHGSTASDPAPIDKGNLVELHVHPYNASGTWWVEINPDYYLYGNSRRRFYGDVFDLHPYATGNSHFITVYINGATNGLEAINGPDVPDALMGDGFTATTPIDPLVYFATPPPGSVICGTIEYTATGSLTQASIYPDRLMWQPLNAIGTSLTTGSVSNLTPLDVANTGTPGISGLLSRYDHVHKGVHSISATGSTSLYGDVSLSSSTLTISQSGNTIGLETNSLVKEALFIYPDVLSVVFGKIRIYNKTGRPWTISSVFLAVNTAPVGASIIVDVKKNGNTIYTTTGNRPSIADGAFTGTQGGTPNVTNVADGDFLTADIVQVGSSAPGYDMTVHVIYS